MIPKMRVKYATQVFSRLVAVALGYFSILDQACDLLGRACSGMLAVNDSDADIPTSGALESSMFHDIATEVEIYEREGEQGVPMDQENTTTGQPLWSRRRRPQMGARHERTEALENITSSFCNVQQQKLSYEQLKVQLLMDEKIFKDSLYKIQLTTAEKELEIKVEILKQIQRGGLSLENIMGKKKDEYFFCTSTFYTYQCAMLLAETKFVFCSSRSSAVQSDVYCKF
ncbi:unnamed protein product [Plutella xylostella]|uniref:(diamondback moth) hypothetical protein n=1 Tax=Plutella xylostella TaxID=51655 RepID=A0A8S4FV16_PLUXY|nr:unnamed protein product [Plutella xylostella]